jgi:hypothetical protein
MVEQIAPIKSPQIGKEKLSREGITVEINQPTRTGKHTVAKTEYAIEVTYQGSYELAEETLQDGTSKLLDENFGTLGSWIATTLVGLGDLKLVFHSAEEI